MKSKPQKLRVADLFCGAGGTSTGAIKAAEKAGYQVELTAINHWQVAVATHTANHPTARHLCTNIDDADPRKLYKPGTLDFLWASPECTHHSRARGGKPMHDQSRATAWCVIRWAEALQPGVIFVENVAEFLEWGPLNSKGRPIASKKGSIFKAWKATLESLGYKVDHRILCAADYGAPTTRQRLIVQAVRGRRRITWPRRTHAPVDHIEKLKTQPELFAHEDPASLQPWVPAREIIDWNLPGRWLDEMPGKAKYNGLPLSPKTLRRIHAGLVRYGIKSSSTSGAHHSLVEPYIVPIDHTGKGRVSVNTINRPLSTITTEARHGLVEPFLVNTAHGGAGDRSASVEQPLRTICGNRGDQALIEPHLLPQHSCGLLRPVSEPAPTITTSGAIALIEPFLTKFYGTAAAATLNEPLDTITTKDRFALVQPTLQFADGSRATIRLRWRMLQPHELAAGMSFPPGYQFTGTKTDAVKQIGNAVPVELAAALQSAHLPAAA